MNTHRLLVRSIIEEGKRGAIAAAVLALGIAACTRTMSLGAAGTPDGGDVLTANDAADAQPDLLPDLQPDRTPDVVADAAPDIVADAAAPDVPGDGQVDHTVDTSPGMNGVDNGITYPSGDIVVRPGCRLSCLCIDGFAGFCTGIPCPVDGSTGVIDPLVVASIAQSASTSSPLINVSVTNIGASRS